MDEKACQDLDLMGYAKPFVVPCRIIKEKSNLCIWIQCFQLFLLKRVDL